MTEDEAKTKHCCGPPAVAHAAYWRGGAAVGDTPALCLGSACMAWRWGGKNSPPSLAEIKAEVDGGRGPLDAVAELNRRNPPGFCGLAGRPE